MDKIRLKMHIAGYITFGVLLFGNIAIVLALFLNGNAFELAIILSITSLIILLLMIASIFYSVTIYQDKFEVRTIFGIKKYNFSEVIIKSDIKGARIFSLENKLIREIPQVIDTQKELYNAYQDYVKEENIPLYINNNVVSYNKKRLPLYIISTIFGAIFVAMFFITLYYVINKIDYQTNDEYYVLISFVLALIGLIYGVFGILKYKNSKVIMNKETFVIKNIFGKEKEYKKDDIFYTFNGRTVSLITENRKIRYPYRSMDNIDLMILIIDNYHSKEEVLH